VNTRALLRLTRQAAAAWSQHNAFRMAAAVAYYTLFSLAPLVVIAVAIAGAVFGEQAARGEIVSQFEHLVGRSGAEVIETVLDNLRKEPAGGLASVISVLVLVVGASYAFAMIQESLNDIWEVQPRPETGLRSFIRKRLLTFSMVLGIGFLLLVSLLLNAALAALGTYLSGVLPGDEMFWQVLNFLVSFLVVTLLLAMILKILPDARIAWRDVWFGAALTAALFSIGQQALGIYLGRGAFTNAYGAAGSLVVLMAWVYYSALILFFGAEFTRAYAESHGSRVQPEEHAERREDAGSEE
jgi:membrane protein